MKHAPAHIFSLLFLISLLASGLSSAEVTSSSPAAHQRAASHSEKLDGLLNSEYTRLGVKPYAIVDDATFVRRAYLRIIGRIPTYHETKHFLDDKSADKRRTFVNQLVDSPGFDSHLFNFWANLLRLNTHRDQFGLGWHLWLRDAVKTNMPYDEMVTAMLTASGHCSDNPAVGYYLRDRNMLLDNVSNTAQVFLGTRIGCAQCHDHPMEDITQKQYYELAAFSSANVFQSADARKKVTQTALYIAKKAGKNIDKPKVKRQAIRKHSRDLRNVFRNFARNALSENASKRLKLPADYAGDEGNPGDQVHAKPLFGTLPNLDEGAQGKEIFAAWLTDPGNPMFTKVIANRLWAHAFGYGLSEPLDDWKPSTQPSHPEALAWMEGIMRGNQYNIKETLRIYFLSDLFQRKVGSEEVLGAQDYHFCGPMLTRLSAEQLHDSVMTIENGSLDNEENYALSRRWKSYTAQIKELLNAPPERIVALNEAIDANDKKLRAPRQKARALRAKISKAKAQGDDEKAQQLQKELREVQLEMRNTNKKTKESQMVSMMNMRNLRTRNRTPLRASERPAPYNPGSFMRDFGASDRNLTNSQHTHATIPQALELLNGGHVGNIADRKGKLASLIKSAKTPEERLNILFLSIYSAYPTEAEKARFLEYADKPNELRALTKAMFNSKRFLFIQ